jgi:hypothetical protein
LTVDKAYYDSTEAYNKERSYSGEAVIRHLQTVCLSQNAQLQTIDRNQSLIIFNKQLNSLKATYLERGGTLTNEEAITMYFDAIAMIDNSHINGSILFMKQQFQLIPSQFAIITQRKLAASALRYQTNTTYPQVGTQVKVQTGMQMPVKFPAHRNPKQKYSWQAHQSRTIKLIRKSFVGGAKKLVTVLVSAVLHPRLIKPRSSKHIDNRSKVSQARLTVQQQFQHHKHCWYKANQK